MVSNICHTCFPKKTYGNKFTKVYLFDLSTITSVY